MKREGDLFDKIIDFENIALACSKAFKGKSNTKEVYRFRSNLIDRIGRIRRDLLNRNFDFGDYRQFTIYEPKERIISAPNLMQRIVHHSVMNICHKYFEKKYIYNCYASRPGKGVHAAVNSVFKASTKSTLYVKLDFRKYFDSIDHNILKHKLSRMFKDKRLLDLFFKIIESYEVKEGKGLPIGNLTSQYFANLYLSDLDHYVLEHIGVKYYCRYMDDVVILASDNISLHSIVEKIMSISKIELALELKTPVYGQVKDGLVFLGYKIFHDRIELSGKSKRRYRRKIKLNHRLHSEGIIHDGVLADRIRALISFTNHAKSVKFRRSCM